MHSKEKYRKFSIVSLPTCGLVLKENFAPGRRKFFPLRAGPMIMENIFNVNVRRSFFIANVFLTRMRNVCNECFAYKE